MQNKHTASLPRFAKTGIPLWNPRGSKPILYISAWIRSKLHVDSIMEIHNIRHLHAYPRWIYLGIHVNPQWNPRAESMPFHMESLYFHGGSRWKCVGTTCFRVEMAWIHVEGVEMANSRWIFLDPSWNDAEWTIWVVGPKWLLQLGVTAKVMKD